MPQYFKPLRQKKYDYLVKVGFLPQEAIEFSRTSRNGMSAPYFRRMINSRRRTVQNLKDNNYSPSEIREYIRQRYIKNGWLKPDSLDRKRIDPWQMLRDQEEKSMTRGEEYESPWRKKTRRKSTKKREVKRITKKDMLQARIQRLQNRRTRSMSDEARIRLDDEIFGYEQELRRLGNQ